MLLQKPRSQSEVYNDLDEDIVNFFRVLRNPVLAAELCEQLELLPYSRVEFEAAQVVDGDSEVTRARKLATRAQMGFGSGGASKSSTGFRSDSKREYGTAAGNWRDYPSRLPEIVDRLRGVMLECLPAVDCMEKHDHPEALFFLDPPYLHSTRELRGKVYRHEMDDADHIELCEKIAGLQGSVILCGYENDLYNDYFSTWCKEQCLSRISAGRGTDIRTETVWLSPNCRAALTNTTMPMFGYGE